MLSEENANYQAFTDSLRRSLAPNDIQLRILRADDPLDTPDLYVAVGLKAAARLASVAHPTLNVLVPKSGYEKLQHSGPHSAIFLDQPLWRQVALLRVILPDVKQVGVLYATPPPELAEARRLLAAKNLHLHERAVGTHQSLSEELDKLLTESEVLFVLPDPDIYNGGTIRNILLAAYRKHIPLIGVSQAFVGAGALCAVFSTPEQMATQTASAVRHYQEQGELPPAQYPTDFEVLVNMQVARSLDLHIKDAELLRDEIRRNP